MPLELYPIQLPQTPAGHARTPLLCILDGSGFAFEYNSLDSIDRLVWGASIAIDIGDNGGSKPTKEQYARYIKEEFACIDDYVEQLKMLIETEILNDDDDDEDDDDFSDDDSDATSESEVENKPKSLAISGFSFGGVLAVELTRRLITEGISSSSKSTRVPITIPRLILFDSVDPSSSVMRASYQQAAAQELSLVLPSMDKFSADSPIVSFMTAHTAHAVGLLADWTPRPLVSRSNGEEGRKGAAVDEDEEDEEERGGAREGSVRTEVPPVHYLRALPKGREGHPAFAEESGYERGHWAKETLPTMDLSTVKLMVDAGHFDIWRRGNVEQVSEWLVGVLGDC